MRFDLESGQFVPFESTNFFPEESAVSGATGAGGMGAAEGIAESIAGMDAASRAEALRLLGPGFLGDVANLYNPDGTPVTGGAGGGTGAGTGVGTDDPVNPFAAAQAAADAVAAQSRVDAFARLRSLLNRYDLGALEGNVRDLIARGITDGDSVLFELRETESFKTRFKANAKRAAAGLPELDPATYIGLEQSYRNVLASNNLPIDFYNDQDDFNALIEGEVSPGELQSRISDGYRKVQDADPEVKRQMQELYGVAEPELLAYFLDPKRARPLLDSAALRRQAEAAAIAARGREQGGLNLTRESAEALAARGITPEEAAAQFAQRGALAGLYNPLTGETALSQEEELGATFGFDPVAAEKLARRRAQRVAEFQGGGSFARTTGATSGTVETGIGTAS